MLVILEIAMLFGGAYALFTGKLPQIFGYQYVIEGTPARIIGFVFMIPLPVAFVIGFVLGMFLGEDGAVFAGILEFGLIVVCLAGGLVYGNRVKRLKDTPPGMSGGPTP